MSKELECLDRIDKRNYLTEREHKEFLGVVEQALLKAQEPKKYIKWEDLEFKLETQEMFVLLNGSYYLLEYYNDSEEDFVFIKATHTTVFELLGERSDDKQFFNDLHLERVEE